MNLYLNYLKIYQIGICIFVTGVPSYEVIWTDIDRLYEGLIPDDQFEGDFY